VMSDVNIRHLILRFWDLLILSGFISNLNLKIKTLFYDKI